MHPLTETDDLAAKPYCILLVEDHGTLREILFGVIESLGYSVVAVASGEDAIRVFSTQSIHLVLLDVNLPGMDGIQTMRRLRESVEKPEVPVIGLSGHGGASHRRRCLDAGMAEYLIKPVGIQRLAETLGGFLNQRS